MDKLYVVVRSDIAPGLQLAQSGHAIVQFASEFQHVYTRWHTESNNLVVLGVKNKTELADLATRLQAEGIECALFCEPDLGGEPTAFAAAPAARRQLSRLPLALRQVPQAAV